MIARALQSRATARMASVGSNLVRELQEACANLAKEGCELAKANNFARDLNAEVQSLRRRNELLHNECEARKLARARQSYQVDLAVAKAWQSVEAMSQLRVPTAVDSSSALFCKGMHNDIHALSIHSQLLMNHLLFLLDLLISGLVCLS